MNNNNDFNDPLDAIVNQYRNVNGSVVPDNVESPVDTESSVNASKVTLSEELITDETTASTREETFSALDNLVAETSDIVNGAVRVEKPVPETPELMTPPPFPVFDKEIDYGDNEKLSVEDLENEEKEAIRKRAEVSAELKKQKELEDAKIPIVENSKDPNYQNVVIGYQEDKLELITRMVERVRIDYNLGKGHIRQTDANGDFDPKIGRQIMGQLVYAYELSGDGGITEQFVNTIRSNWVNEEDEPQQQEAQQEETTSNDVKSEGPEIVKTQIDIKVEPNTPVTLNIDGSILEETQVNQIRQVDVVVREISNKEVTSRKVVTNSSKPGVIKPYSSDLNDVPITLVHSGYRCTMRAINWMNYLKLAAPIGSNPMEMEMSTWSILYHHQKNTSIGEFKSLKEFMQNTKYEDKGQLSWGLLVATSDLTEKMSVPCPNPKCKHKIIADYHPREIIHINSERMPSWFNKAEYASGEVAKELYKEVNASHREYTLPDTGIKVEIADLDAWTFVNEKIPIMMALWEELRPGVDISMMAKTDDPANMVVDYLIGNAMHILSMTVPGDDGQEYKYTSWEGIREVIEVSLSPNDSAILMEIIRQVKTEASPISFYVENVQCPMCQHTIKRVNVRDIVNELLFHVAQRLASMRINLINLQSK